MSQPFSSLSGSTPWLTASSTSSLHNVSLRDRTGHPQPQHCRSFLTLAPSQPPQQHGFDVNHAQRRQQPPKPRRTRPRKPPPPFKVPSMDDPELVQDLVASTHWLLFQTKSWNTSQLHWREARHLTEWWVRSYWLQSQRNHHNSDAATALPTHPLSHSRMVLQLLERAIHEQPDRVHDVFWEDPVVATRLMTDVWTLEQQQQQDVGDKPTWTIPTQFQDEAMCTPPTVDEVREWITLYGPSLPNSVVAAWNTVLESQTQQRQPQPSLDNGNAAIQPSMGTTGLPVEESSQPLPQHSPAQENISALRFRTKLLKAPHDDGFQSIRDVNAFLGDLIGVCDDEGLFLNALDTLWEPSHALQPNASTYQKVMEGVLAARGQERPSLGTGLILWDVYQELCQAHRDEQTKHAADAPKHLSLHPRKAQLFMVLDTMEREQSGAYGAQAWELWESNLTRWKQKQLPSYAPHAKLAHSVLTLLERSDATKVPDIPGKAQSILHVLREGEQAMHRQSKENEQEPTLSFFGMTHQERQEHTKRKFNPWQPPSQHFWVAYLNCLVKEEGDHLEEAETLLRKPLDTWGDGTIHADNRMYGIVLRALTRAGKPDQAEAVFQSMTEAGVKPDSKTVLDMVVAWTDAPMLSIPEKSAGIARVLSMVDDTSVASSLLHMLSTGQEAKDAGRAELLFKSLLYEKNTTVSLGAEDFSAVITALSRSPTASPQRAETILMELIRQSDADPDNTRLTPPESAFTSTIVCWGKSSDEHAALRAQNVFDLLVHRYQKQRSTLQPSKAPYTALINAWARANDPKRAEQVLMQLLNEYQEKGNDGAQPDLIAFNSVLHAWNTASRRWEATVPKDDKHHHQHRRNEPFERTKAILDLMLELGQEWDVAPDRTTFALVISTLARSTREDKADLARFYVKQAKTQLQTPDPFLLSAVLQVLKTQFQSQGTREQAQEMLNYLEEMLQLVPLDRRSVVLAHDAVLFALMKLASKHSHFAADQAELLLERFLHVCDSRRSRGGEGPPLAPDRSLIFKVLVIYAKTTTPVPSVLQVREAMDRFHIPMDPGLQRLFAECGVVQPVLQDMEDNNPSAAT